MKSRHVVLALIGLAVGDLARPIWLLSPDWRQPRAGPDHVPRIRLSGSRHVSGSDHDSPRFPPLPGIATLQCGHDSLMAIDTILT